MRKAALVLMAIACCLIVPQTASAEEYKLMNPPIVYGNGVELHGATMVPTPGRVTSVKLGGTERFEVDSFFDVFTELTLESGQLYHIDSFFDVFTELSVPGLPPAPAELTGPVEVVVRPRAGTTGLFDTEIVSMSLSGSAGPTPVIVRENPAPFSESLGGTEITDIGGGLYHIDSFFDVFTELSVDGGSSWSVGSPPAKMETPPLAGSQKHDTFYGQLMPGPSMLPPPDSGGSGWDGDGVQGGDWITYPDPPDGGEPWVNQWFYNDPFDPDRWKEVFWDITVAPADPGGAGGVPVEIAINWSNEQFPDGTGQPPMPDQENAIERAIIWTEAGGIPSDMPGMMWVGSAGEIILVNPPADGTPFIIPDYNPEWVSIDIRFADGTTTQGVLIDGDIWHECVPEPTTMAFLALGGLAVLRRRRR